MFQLLLLLLLHPLAAYSAKCEAWHQTGNCDPDSHREENGDKSCTETVQTGNSGYCQCANNVRAGYVTCKHDAFTCQETCARTNILGYLEDTIWMWNDWRPVEFRSGGIFYAPEDYCRDGKSCKWSVVNGNAIEIQWSGAGLHTVTLGPDRRSMKGQRYDGDLCHAVFQRRDLEAGTKRHKERREANGADDEDEDDLYNVLGVDPDSEESTIKKAYRKARVPIVAAVATRRYERGFTAVNPPLGSINGPMRRDCRLVCRRPTWRLFCVASISEGYFNRNN